MQPDKEREKVSTKVAQGAGIVCILIGICGIIGAMEWGTGLIQSVIFFAAGMVLMYLAGKSEKKSGSRCTYSSYGHMGDEGELNVR